MAAKLSDDNGGTLTPGLTRKLSLVQSDGALPLTTRVWNQSSDLCSFTNFSKTSPKTAIESLIIASKSGNCDQVSMILDAGVVTTDCRDQRGNTPLIWACVNGNVAATELLIDAGASVDCTNDDGETALMKASSSGHRRCVQVLLAGGATVSVVGTCNYTALMYAVMFGHLPVIETIVMAFPDQVNFYSDKEVTAVDIALSLGEKGEPMLQFLRDHGGKSIVELVEKVPSPFSSPMKESVSHPPVTFVLDDSSSETTTDSINGDVHRLLSAGDNLDYSDPSSLAATLLSAAKKSDVATLRRILSLPLHDQTRTVLNSAERAGFSSLMWAVRNGRIDIVELLVASGADPGVVNSQGDNAFLKACMFGELEIARYFVLICGADVCFESEDGYTGLIMSAAYGHPKVVEFLLKSPKVDKDQMNRAGLTALDFAHARGETDVINVLIASGGHRGVEVGAHASSFNVRSDGPQAIALYYSKHQSDLGDLLILAVKENDYSKVNRLIIDGAPIGYDDSDAMHPVDTLSSRHMLTTGSALAIACFNGYLDIARHLIATGAMMDQLLNNGTTSIHEASALSACDVLRLLLESSLSSSLAKICTLKNSKLETPFHIAAGKGQLSNIKLLFSMCRLTYNEICSASPSIASPADYAIKAGHVNVAEYFHIAEASSPPPSSPSTLASQSNASSAQLSPQSTLSDPSRESSHVSIDVKFLHEPPEMQKSSLFCCTRGSCVLL